MAKDKTVENPLRDAVEEKVNEYIVKLALSRALTEWNTKHETGNEPKGKGRWLIQQMLKTVGEEL